MSISKFEVQEGFSIEGLADILKGTVDPSAGGGVAAPIGSLYMRTTNGETWHKTSAPDTGWVFITDANSISVEDGYQNAFMGKNAPGNEMPDYSSNFFIADSDSLEVAAGKLDAAINAVKYVATATNQDADPAILIDSLPVASVCMAEWHICITETATPTKRESFKVTALNDGTITNIDSTIYAKNKVGGGITGLVMDVIGSAGNMSLQILATNAIDISFYRFKG